MRRVAILSLWLLGCSGSCGDDTEPRPAEEAPRDRGNEATDDEEPDAGGDDGGEASIGLPPYDEATPATLQIINGRDQPIRIVVSHGDGQPFSIQSRPGEPSFGLGGTGPPPEGPSCTCRCGYECRVCEPPQHAERTLQPGETHEFLWSGRVRVPSRNEQGDRCFEPYAAPPGPRTFRACLGDITEPNHDCVDVSAELPTRRIEFRFTGISELDGDFFRDLARAIQNGDAEAVAPHLSADIEISVMTDVGEGLVTQIRGRPQFEEWLRGELDRWGPQCSAEPTPPGCAYPGGLHILGVLSCEDRCCRLEVDARLPDKLYLSEMCFTDHAGNLVLSSIRFTDGEFGR